jgi:hypothetical protein
MRLAILIVALLFFINATITSVEANSGTTIRAWRSWRLPTRAAYINGYLEAHYEHGMKCYAPSGGERRLTHEEIIAETDRAIRTFPSLQNDDALLSVALTLGLTMLGCSGFPVL